MASACLMTLEAAASDMCQLTMSRWSAALGWSRERAMQFMKENTLLSDTEIATETLRYSVDIPGQALAYKIGSLRMIELRRRAERELGAKFDVRQFHEWVIGSGTMPLPVLEQHIERQLHRTKHP